MSHRWMKFWPQDWRGDVALRGCSVAARGLWIDMVCLMHEANPYGHLTVNGKAMNARHLATLTGLAEKEAVRLLAELEGAGIFSKAGDGTIYSRRMVRDYEKSEEGRRNIGLRADRQEPARPHVSPHLSPPIRVEDSPPVTLEAEAEAESTPSLRSGVGDGDPPEDGKLRPKQVLLEGMRVWNEACGGRLAKVTKPTDSRRDCFVRRFRDDFGENWDQWRRYCERVAASPFLTNAAGNNKSGWKADFDFVLEPRNLARISEGVWDAQRRLEVVAAKQVSGTW